jgi:hypothetical protein
MTAAANSNAVKPTRPPQTVIAAFVSLTGVTHTDLIARCRLPARAELCWLLRDLTYLSLAGIGELLDGRDPTTIAANCAGAADRMATDREYRDRIAALRTAILAWTSPPDTQPASIARRVLSDADRAEARTQTLAIAVASVGAILASSDLSDADARLAALTVLRNGSVGVAHG